MALQSMTGFSRASGSRGDLSWVWEMRSVNGKGLDVRLRLPNGYDALEVSVKKAMSALFSRGNIQIGLQITNHATDIVPVINHEALDALITASDKIRERVGGEMPSVAELMAMRGIVEYSEPETSEQERDQRDKALLDSLKETGLALQAARVEEGASIVNVLSAQVSEIETLQQKIKAHPARKPDAIKEHLKTQVAKLLDANEALDEQRLHQEVAILAAKADLQEELDRLAVHVTSARNLLSGNGPAGRKLDFLAQEFNRECNTICSKSNSGEVTALGLDMKLVIDQFREQIQNME